MADIAAAEIGSPSLNERLLGEGADGAQPVGQSTGMSGSRKKLLLAVVAAVGVACIVIGAVAASGSFSHSSSSSASSSSSSSEGSFAAVTSVQSRPVFSKPVGSLANAPAPTVVKSNKDTETATFTFRHSSTNAQGLDSHTHLHYTATKRRNAHCPSNHESVVAIDCLPSRLRLSFANASEALVHASQWLNGTIFFLRHEWGCGMHIRKFVSSPRVNGRFFIVDTVNATLPDAFQHANISFFTNHSESPIVLPTPEHARRRRSLWSSIGDALFGSTSNAVSSLLGLVVTGDLNINTQPFSTSYSLPYTTWTDQDPAGNGEINLGYQADLYLNTNIQLVISDYSVSTFSATVTSNLDALITANVEAQFDYSNQNSEPLTSQITLASGTIPVFGVQIPINMFVQVMGGYQASGDASASLSGNATATGSATAGFAYTSGQGVAPTGNAQLQGNVNLAPPTQQLAASVNAYVMPQFSLQAAYIGSLASNIVVSGQAGLPAGSCSVSESVTAEIDVGSQISFNIPYITSYSSNNPITPVWGPQTIFSDSEYLCG